MFRHFQLYGRYVKDLAALRVQRIKLRSSLPVQQTTAAAATRGSMHLNMVRCRHQLERLAAVSFLTARLLATCLAQASGLFAPLLVTTRWPVRIMTVLFQLCFQLGHAPRQALCRRNCLSQQLFEAGYFTFQFGNLLGVCHVACLYDFSYTEKS